MANCGHSNPTPWDTPRETDEETLEKHLEESLQGIDDFTSAIFNFHVPPTTPRSTSAEARLVDRPAGADHRRRRATVGAGREHAVRNVVEK